MAEITKAIEHFLTLDYGSGYGSGEGYGYGDGYGSGEGSGYGSGEGCGYGSGSGDGSGYGSGEGYGSGSGEGSGYGSGEGYGYGSGSGYGSGYGDGLITFNGNKVYHIDGVPTVIKKVHLNLAKGYIVNNDLTTKQCFIAKGNNKFAHGATYAEARTALQDKIFEDMDTDEKIEMFIKEFKLDIKYPAKTFYDWHHKLTGSCEFGRNAFVENHGIDIENGMYTVQEFIEYTKNDFGGDVIKKIAKEMMEGV